MDRKLWARYDKSNAALKLAMDDIGMMFVSPISFMFQKFSLSFIISCYK